MLGLSGWVSFLVPLAAAITAWLLGRVLGNRISAVGVRADAALEHRAAPWIVGVLTTAVVWYVWGGLARTPVISDEVAYLLQAQLFAKGAWKAPGPPLPEFFEQSHVIVTPLLASKYYPGHSLLMAPGAAIGLPALVPLILTGLTGAFMFLLARAVAGGRVALLTWMIWISCYPAIYFRATYLSEMTSAAAWTIAWWCLLQWRRTATRAWMLGLAGAIGVVAITRPLTAVALAIPVGIVVLRDCNRARSWRQLGAGVITGAAVLCVIPLWSVATTGSALETPHAFYTRQYMPHDRIGFSYDTTLRAERPLPGSRQIDAKYIAWRRDHTLQALPRIALDRARIIARDMWYEWRAGLMAFAIVGLLVSPAAAWFGYATLLLHVGLYLLYAGPPAWTVYYMESVPMLAFMVAAAIAAVIRRAAAAGSRSAPSHAQAGGALAVVALALVAIMPATRTWRQIRAHIDADHAYFERFDELAARIPDERALVFVRYAPDHHEDYELVRNPPGHENARLWIVFDRGAENAGLIRRAPERRPWLFDESTWTLQRLQ